MSTLTKTTHGKQSRRSLKTRTTMGIFAVTLGMAASVAAAPPRKNASVDVKGTVAKMHWFQVGRASWYGKEFQGHRTADGEKYNMNALTCAHRTLPLGSWVRVTNLNNRRTTFVRVNDRGPVPQSRILDLSYAAARKLGIGGTARVKVEPVSTNDPSLMASLTNDVHLPDLAHPPLGGRATGLAEK